MHEIFQYPKFLETLKSIPQNFPVLWLKQIYAKTGQPPSFINSFLSTPENFWNTDLTRTKFFGPVKQKNFSTKLYAPLLLIKTSMPEFFWNKEGFPCEFFRHPDTKNFRHKQVISFLMHKVRRYPSMSETLNRYTKKLFGILRLQKSSTEVSDIHFLCMKILNTRSFSKHWRVSNKIFRYCGSNKLTQKRDNPLLLSIVCCPHQKYSGTQIQR